MARDYTPQELASGQDVIDKLRQRDALLKWAGKVERVASVLEDQEALSGLRALNYEFLMDELDEIRMMA